MCVNVHQVCIFVILCLWLWVWMGVCSVLYGCVCILGGHAVQMLFGWVCSYWMSKSVKKVWVCVRVHACVCVHERMCVSFKCVCKYVCECMNMCMWVYKCMTLYEMCDLVKVCVWVCEYSFKTLIAHYFSWLFCQLDLLLCVCVEMFYR